MEIFRQQLLRGEIENRTDIANQWLLISLKNVGWQQVPETNR
jgi:hypothetical protein